MQHASKRSEIHLAESPEDKRPLGTPRRRQTVLKWTLKK
jgi:hypothetical protein